MGYHDVVRPLLSALSYFVACCQLIPAAIMVMPEHSSYYKRGIALYISACTLLTCVGILDFVSNIVKNCGIRKDQSTQLKLRSGSRATYRSLEEGSATTLEQPPHSKQAQSLSGGSQHGHDPAIQSYSTQEEPPATPWLATAIDFFYLVGGACFLGGAVLYWPPFGSDAASIGTKVFRTGSCAYLCGSLGSVYSVLMAARQAEISCCVAGGYLMGLAMYIVGACLFIVGGVDFANGHSGSGSTAWLWGGNLFFGGATVFLLLLLSGMCRSDDTEDAEDTA